MAAHSSPPVPFSSDTEFPIQVDNLEQFQSLLDSFKHKLFLNLTSTESISSSSTIKILETKTYKIGKLVLKRTEKTITNPEELELPIPVFNPDEYTIEDLWTVLAKQGKLRKLRVLLLGRRVKGSLAASIMKKMNRKRKIRPIINREDTAKWLTIRKAVFDKLTEQQKAEWGLLSGLMVVSKGGRLLDLKHGDKQEEVIQEGPQLQRIPTDSNRSTTKSITNISTPCAYPTHRTDEHPKRPGNFPRVRQPSTPTTTELQPALAALEQRVRQLEIGSRSQPASSEPIQNFTGKNFIGRSHSQLLKGPVTKPPEGGRMGNREASARGPSPSILSFEGSGSTGGNYGTEDDEEDEDDWYEGDVETQSEYSVSMLSDSSIGSALRNECMSPVDWVAFAKD